MVMIFAVEQKGEPMDDLISRLSEMRSDYNCFDETEEPYYRALSEAIQLASAQPELPSYVAEIEEEYQKAVKSPYIHKPLAKALYEVWKKHDREDAERRTDENNND